MQAKDVPEAPILNRLVAEARSWTMLCELQGVSELADIPEKVLRAKMRSLLKRGLVTGCACGCRGDYNITDAGEAATREVGG